MTYQDFVIASQEGNIDCCVSLRAALPLLLTRRIASTELRITVRSSIILGVSLFAAVGFLARFMPLHWVVIFSLFLFLTLGTFFVVGIGHLALQAALENPKFYRLALSRGALFLFPGIEETSNQD